MGGAQPVDPYPWTCGCGSLLLGTWLRIPTFGHVVQIPTRGHVGDSHVGWETILGGC